MANTFIDNQSAFDRRQKTREHWSSKLPKLPLLETWLVDNNKMTQDQAAECLNIAREEGINFAQVVVDKHYVQEKTILNFYADTLGLEIIDGLTRKMLDQSYDFDQSFFNRFETAVLDNMNIIPVRYEGGETSSVIQFYQVSVILSDPWQLREVTNIVANVVRFMNMEKLQKPGLAQEPARVSINDVQQLNEEPQLEIVAYLCKSGEIKQMLQEITNISAELLEDTDKEEAEALRQWNDIFNKAIKMKASDIHVSPLSSKGGLWVRYRVDGDMEDITRSGPGRYSRREYDMLLNKLMVMSSMDYTQKAIPQSGVLSHIFEQTSYDMRVEVVYTSASAQSFDGCTVTIRILYESSTVALQNLGLYPADLHLIELMYGRPSGMILATGPTSSGKSTTIFSILSQMDLIHRSCYTAENPVEYKLENAYQIPISDRVGRTYELITKSLMRLDPDIIYIGEIRDESSAKAGIQMANTGHTVFSTLHTNSSYSVTQRLSSWGIDPFMLSSGLTGVIAQRLVRRNCPHCLVEYKPSQQAFDSLELPAGTYFKSSGYLSNGTLCPFCRGKGVKGRIGIYEMLPLFKHMGWEKYINDPPQLKAMFKGLGYPDLYGDAMAKVRDKSVSPENILGIIAPPGTESGNAF